MLCESYFQFLLSSEKSRIEKFNVICDFYANQSIRVLSLRWARKRKKKKRKIDYLVARKAPPPPPQKKSILRFDRYMFSKIRYYTFSLSLPRVWDQQEKTRGQTQDLALRIMTVPLFCLIPEPKTKTPRLLRFVTIFCGRPDNKKYGCESCSGETEGRR